VQPAQSLSSSLAGFFLNTRFPSPCALTVWRLTNPFSGARQLRSTERTLPAPCGFPPDAAQPDVARRIETGGPRIINAVLRDGFLWGAAAVAYNWGSGTVAAARVFQVEVRFFPTLTVRQDFLQGADGVDVYYPAVSVDAVGNAALVFNQSSPSRYVSVGVAGQAAGAPRNQLLSAETLQDGAGPYVLLDGSGRNRWGDYNGITVDPIDGRFWVIGEYAEAPIPNPTPSTTPESRWGTWIGAMVVGTPPPTATPTRTPPPTRTPTRTRPPTPTATSTRTPTGTRTATPTPTETGPTRTPTPTPTASDTPTETPTPTPPPTPTHTATPTDTPTATDTPTPTRTPTPPPSPTPTVPAGDVDGDGVVDAWDLALVTRFLFLPTTNPAADVNRDGTVSAPDLSAVGRDMR